MKKLFLVDAYALIYRCYYAFLGRPMRNSEGMNTSAVFGFTKFLKEIINKESPDYLGVAFDPKGGNFRNELFPAYKANRTETPEDIIASVPYIKRILEAMRIPILEIAGYEADDVIGTLSAKAADSGFEVFMVTPDKDFGQLIRPNVYIYKQLKGGEGVEIIGAQKIKEHYGLDDPRLVIDILALWGDAADNIPGVMGIGEKGAIKLVTQYGTVENILANTDKLSGKQKDNIIASSEQLLLSKRLATIEMDVPIEFCPDQLVFEGADVDALRQIYTELGFTMFIRELGRESGVESQSAEAYQTTTLFGSVPQTPAHRTTPKAKPKAALKGQGSLFGEEFSPVGTFAFQSADNDEISSDEINGVQTDLFGESGFATAQSTPHTYHVVESESELVELVAELRAYGEFCFDTETTGLDIFNDRMVGVSFCIKAHEAYYLPCDKVNTLGYVAIMKPLFEDDKIAKIGQNIKFDMMVLANLGIEVRGFKYDTMILHYLLDPESRHNMNYLSRKYLNYDPIEIESLIGRGAKQITMDMVSSERVSEYAAEDADLTFRLKEILWPAVVADGLVELYSTIEEPLIEVLAELEMSGVKIDSAILSEFGVKLTKDLAMMEAQIREMAQEPNMNVNSARQLGEALFGKLKIDPKPKMTKTKQYRTDEESLQMLSDRHPIVGLILEYRGVKKLLSTYIDALPLLVNSKTGRVHASFNQAVTATGRLSSTNPNLQNIPIRDKMGREIRKAFVPADAGHILLSADYSQVELRIMAHLSEDPALVEAFDHGEDVHAATAAKVFNVPIGEVTSEQRRRAKTANFGIIYGISAFGLAQRLNIPRTEAKQIIDGYFASYPGVKTYMDNVISQAHSDGYVSTIFGRKRYLADIGSGNAVARGLAERNAINAPIQGSAADIMKLAMIAVHRGFKASGLRSRVIMQVHDELVVDVYKPEQEQVAKIVVDAMEHAAALKVLLTVDYGIGENWVEAH